MFEAKYRRVMLRFKEPAITSRATMTEKETYLLKISDTSDPDVHGVGEVPIFRGLSAEDTPEFENILDDFVKNFSLDKIPEISSIRFGVESALMNLKYLHTAAVGSDFSYLINGLIWMGDKVAMAERIKRKLELGFRCIKLKIGGINFEDELELLRYVRNQFGRESLELRLDANGAFSPANALVRLEQLSHFGIHSIEQPIKAGQYSEMAEIIRKTPIPIALDEELIGFSSEEHKQFIISTLKPHYIILKPSLCGGFGEAEKWIGIAKKNEVGWWVTSALESNIGLTAIALWLRKFNPVIPQGLGTGELYVNNYVSPLAMEGNKLVYHHDREAIWNL